MTPDQTDTGDDVAAAIALLRKFVSDRSKFGGETIDGAIETLIRAAEENAGLRTNVAALHKIADTNAHAANEYMKMRDNLSTENYHLRKENAVLRAKFPEPPEGWKWVMQPIAEDPWHDEKEGC